MKFNQEQKAPLNTTAPDKKMVHEQASDSEYDSFPVSSSLSNIRNEATIIAADSVAEREKSFAAAIFRSPDEEVSFKSGKNGFLLNVPINVEIVAVERTFHEANESSRGSVQWNPFLYSIDVNHGHFRWSVKKRYNHFLKLHTAIMFVMNAEDQTDDASAATKNYETFEKEQSQHQEVRKRATLLKRLKSTTMMPDSVARFPRKPDFLISSEDAVNRQKQLQDYLNAILQCHEYRTHPETLDFFEVSELSFAQDLIKGKEGVVRKMAGSDHHRGGFFKWLIKGLMRCLCGFFMGHRWYKVWMIVQESCLIFIDMEDGSINSVLLFDPGFQVMQSSSRKHSMSIKNLSQSVTVAAASQFRFIEWNEAIHGATIKGQPGFDYIQDNRFGSFAPLRENCKASYFVDGQDYMASVADALLQAKEEIYIADWWLSPEIYLKRGIELSTQEDEEHFRLDRILNKKAAEGVKIFILLYKEFQWALGLNSFYTKKTLMSKNIKIMRHPDRNKAEINEYLWAHHEKLVVIDQSLAFVGGIDLCYGRWDNSKHMLTDLSDSHVGKLSVIPPTPSTSSRPVSLELPGKHIMYGLKAAHDVTVAPIRALAAVSPLDQNGANSYLEDQGDATHSGHKQTGRVRRGIRKAYRKAKRKLNMNNPSETDSVMAEDDNSSDSSDDSVGSDSSTHSEENLRRKMSVMAKRVMFKQRGRTKNTGVPSVNIQMMEDLDDAGSSGTTTTTSALTWRAKDYVNFIVKDVARPDLPDQDNVDRRTTARMPWHDIAVAVQGQAARDVARHFIQRWNAIKREKAKFSKQYPYLVPRRSLHANPTSAPIDLKSSSVKCQVLRSASQWSIGSARVENSIYAAMLTAIQNAQHYVYIENQFFITSSSSSSSSNLQNLSSNLDSSEDIRNKIGRALADKVIEAHKRGKQFKIFILLPLLPAFEGDIGSQSTGNALRIILHFNYTSICKGPNSLFKRIEANGINPSHYVSFCSLRQHGVLLSSPVTELIYIHSKLMIVDDATVICGSANINDRSLLGSRDSEMALIFEDQAFDQGVLGGENVKCGKLAGSLRKRLMREHLGPGAEVEDCISDSFYKDVWLRRASRNTKLFEEIFQCIPTDEVRNLEENRKYLSQRPLADMDKFVSLQKINQIQGYLVLLPLHYLEDENLLPPLFAKEGFVPTVTWT